MPTEKIITPLLPDNYYHIYNQGNDRIRLFYTDANYAHFLNKYKFLMKDYVDTYAYCLIGNHFHFLIKVKESTQENYHLMVSHQFRRLFQSYALSINKQEGRSGSLFRKHFRRIHVQKMDYLRRLVFYIHFNPQKHQLVQNFRKYPYSSYGLFLRNSNDFVRSDVVIEWFNDFDDFLLYHDFMHDERKIQKISLEDD